RHARHAARGARCARRGQRGRRPRRVQRSERLGQRGERRGRGERFRGRQRLDARGDAGETAGPYPGDGSNGPDVLETSGVERSDIRSSIDSDTTAEGTGLEITLNIIDMAGGDVPMEGAAVYLWHCDA